MVILYIVFKYNRGRVPANMTWVLGMVNLDDSSKGIFLCVADRRADTLIPAIRTYVQQGATIVTDCWRGYDQLAQNGYMHLTVNHSRNFVDPRTGVFLFSLLPSQQIYLIDIAFFFHT